MTEPQVVANIPRPTPAQLDWQRDGFGVFFHFGLNTFHDVEWSDGTLPAGSFDPTAFDAEQWVRVAADAGARYVVLTAKHHDGFCLWPTATTDYSVASSPWRGSRGDVVAAVADACRRRGVKLGLYLSPWDRHEPSYADPAAYDAFYLAQLRELCTDYGELSELWFDGAGSEGRTYDWPAVMALVRELQPGAMVFNMGEPTIRWVGNEDGLAHDPVEYAASRTDVSNYSDATAALGTAAYVPPECDVSIRPGWFWHASEGPKSLDHLLAIFYGSLGMGANLLLNLPPDRRGLIGDADAARLAEFAAELRRRFAAPHAARLTELGGGAYELDFGATVRIDHLELREALAEGQRAGAHRVFALPAGLPHGRDPSGAAPPIAQGGTIGIRRIHVFAGLETDRLRVELDGPGAVLEAATGYGTGVEHVPGIEYEAPTERPDASEKHA